MRSQRLFPRVLILFGILTVTVSVSAQVQIGLVSYLEGTVEIVRQGALLNASMISYGDPVFMHDVVQTGSDSYAEVELTGQSGAGSTIRVNENSAYYVEVDPLPTGSNDSGDTKIRLLGGSVEIAVQQLRPGARFSVQTNTAVLGVRGTTFDVLTAPDETTLLGVREGKVLLVAQGGTVEAAAGTAAEAQASGEPTVKPVPDGDFVGFYEDWEATRLAVFRSGASTFVVAYARRYQDTVDDFNAAYRDLAQYRAKIQDAVRTPPSMGELALLKMETGPALIRMRSILPLFENVVYRLRELERLHRQGIGMTTIDGRPSSDFFRAFSAQQQRLTVELSAVRYIFDLYRRLDEQSFGGMPGSNVPSSNVPQGAGSLGGVQF